MAIRRRLTFAWSLKMIPFFFRSAVSQPQFFTISLNPVGEKTRFAFRSCNSSSCFAGAMKLSFSLPSKSASSKPNLDRIAGKFDDRIPSRHEGNSTKEFVSEFDASKSLARNGKPDTPVIPPMQNEWMPAKKMKNLHLPFSESMSDALRFEQESPSLSRDGPDSKMSYGLNLRQSTDATISASIAIEVEDKPEGRVRPTQPASVEFVLIQKLKEDLERLPEAQGFAEFDKVSVEEFGTALLVGYGWHEGRGIGKNAKADTKIVQCVRRTDRQGLGFLGDIRPPSHKKEGESDRGGEHEKGRKIGEEERSSETGRDRDRDGFAVGKQVRLIGGRDAGHRGTILQKLDEDWLMVKLTRSCKRVELKVRSKDVAELGSHIEKNFLRKFKERKIQAGDKEEKKVHSRTLEVKVEASKRKADLVNGGGQREEGQRNSQVPWLVNHIRVRIISEDFRGGKFYRKKGEIVDVSSPTTCDISLDDTRDLIQGVSQDYLETALPKRGGSVLVLYGKHKGVYGTLVGRDLDQETGIVRDADNHALLTLRLDQIAEYVGDPSYLGY